MAVSTAQNANTVSRDSRGNFTGAVCFRFGNIGTPISVTATAALVPTSEWRNSIKLQNTGSNVVYYGFDDTVDDTDGLPIGVGQSEILNIGSEITLYVVCATGDTSTLKFGELG